MEHILFICNLLISIVGILYAARTVYMAVGLFQTRTFASAKALHTYAVVIASVGQRGICKPSVNREKLWYSLMFPIFSIMGDIATWIAVFCKVTWKPIPHHADIRIDEIE